MLGTLMLVLFLCLFALRSAHLAGRLSEDGLAAGRQKLAQWADAYEQAIPAGEALLRSRYRQLSAMQTVCIAGAGAAWGVDPQLITAIIAIESGGNPAVVSKSGAVGLMQLKPSTSGRDVYRRMGWRGEPSGSELKNPERNISMGAA